MKWQREPIKRSTKNILTTEEYWVCLETG